MKNDNIFIIIAVSVCFVLLSVVYSLEFYEFTIDWDNISGTILGIYLYLAYLFLSFICGKPKNQMRYSQRTALHGKNQKAYSSEVYEY